MLSTAFVVGIQLRILTPQLHMRNATAAHMLRPSNYLKCEHASGLANHIMSHDTLQITKIIDCQVYAFGASLYTYELPTEHTPAIPSASVGHQPAQKPLSPPSASRFFDFKSLKHPNGFPSHPVPSLATPIRHTDPTTQRPSKPRPSSTQTQRHPGPDSVPSTRKATMWRPPVTTTVPNKLDRGPRVRGFCSGTGPVD
ncbi:hypothetical protein CC80DRAFT_509840 [Byssothecium circinans]|uniref:Uncharacterized protein n=1 Tax=Byssothecium circinans TaxID=147558 RepID=A0A6A5TEV2_9PLEO|nr:hypothetical protein CC80DRAFT_509840 [Byssothecium circinans]